MQIPHKIEIKKGVFYTVAFVDKFDDPNQLGACASKSEKSGCRTILILRSLSKAEQEEIFVHEFLHAIEFEYRIAIPHKLIYALQKPLRQVLVMNPQAFIPHLFGAASKRKRRKTSKGKRKRT